MKTSITRTFQGRRGRLSHEPCPRKTRPPLSTSTSTSTFFKTRPPLSTYFLHLFSFIALLALATAHAAPVATTGVPASAYVQDGLVAMYDGIENAGAMQHDDEATVWADLIGGGGDGTLNENVTWTANGWSNNANGKPVTVDAAFSATIAALTFTLEFRATPSRRDTRECFVGNYNGSGFNLEHNSSSYTGGRLRPYYSGSPDWATTVTITNDETATASLVSTAAKQQMFKGGVLAATRTGSIGASTSALNPTLSMIIGGEQSRDSMAFRGVYHAVRLYNRALSTEEVALNAILDRMRYEGASSNDTGVAYVDGALRMRTVATAADGAEVSFDGENWATSAEAWHPTGTVVSVRARVPEGAAIAWPVKPSGATLSDDLQTLTFTSSVPASVAVQAGDTVTWNNHDDNTSYYWSDAAKWTCSDGVTHRVPQYGDAVVIPNRGSYPYNGNTIIVTNLLPKLRSVYVGSRRTLRLGGGWTNKLEATERVAVYGEGTGNWGSCITCSGGFTDSTMSNRIWIVTPELVLSNAYASVSANAAGYAWANGPAWIGITCPSSACAPHGGNSSTWQGKMYGSITEPTDPGSGAGGNDSFKPSGGGAIRIQATNVVINGAISCTGDTSWHGWGGGSGSGGSVFISCRTISGAGSVSANGGGNTASNGKGAGGGGRVAVHYDAVAQSNVNCLVAFGARGGADLNGSGPRCAAIGGSGSVYLTDGQFLKRPGRMLAGYVYYGPDVTKDNELVGENLSLTNTLVEISTGGRVCVTGDLRFVCSATRTSGLRVSGSGVPVDISGSLSLAGARLLASYATRVSVGGDLTMVGNSSAQASAEIYLQASATNGVDQAYGATLDVGGKWTMGQNAAYYPVCNPTNGAIVAARSGSFSMDSTAAISADLAGWGKDKGRGASYYGAGHGGKGGSSWGGGVYGDAKHPLAPGSGTSGTYGQAGGGVIYISTRGKMALGGTLSANGASSYAWHYGVGSSAGGSIYLTSGGRLTGKATLTADGGYAQGSGYGGGGGRIAIWHRGACPDAHLTTSVAGGKYRTETERSSSWGEDGSVYWHRTGGTCIILK